MGTTCTSNATEWQYITAKGDLYSAAGLNEIQTSINDEQTRRDISNTSFSTKYKGDLSKSSDLILLRDKIDECLSRTWENTFNAGEIITSTKITELHDALNNAEVACICNCDYCTCNCDYCTCNCNYCTCNCDYCTCNCNYCTCNCNYCTCNCNYSCTCDCNYSDERLKTDIIYI